MPPRGIYHIQHDNFFYTEEATVKTKHLLVQSHASHFDTKLKDFKIREAINYDKYLNNYTYSVV